MANNNRLVNALNRFMDVPSSDPDDARRRKLLNIILGGLAFLGILIFVTTSIVSGLEILSLTIQDTQFIYFSGAGLLVGTLVFYVINRNRKIPGWIASGLFLVFITVVLAFSDAPQELANGRSLFVFAIPVIMAGILLRPVYSFVFSALTSIEIAALAKISGTDPNVYAMISYFMVAIVSWLSARSLEQALKELRSSNINLDRMVQARTKELADALSRERVESGRSKAILESIADGVIVFDLHGRATIANPSSVRLLEMPYDIIIGSTIDDLSQSKALDARNRGILAGLLSNPDQQLTNSRIRWSKKTLSVTSAQVNDTADNLVGTVAVFRDYTREAEVDQMKNTFLAIVSHELRTPLNAILGYAEMIKEAVYGPVTEKQVRGSERIMTNSRRLLDIVSDLLDQAQIEAGKLTVHMHPFRPADLVENIHGVMDKIAADKSLVLTSELDSELPESINGDMARLQQVVVNLINNAIKFTESGSVHVRLFPVEKQRWSLEVQDTGIGIPEEELPTIFEAFRQVDSTATRKHGGFGIGLSIVKQLAEIMGGEVTVSSKIGVGSIFTVTLPLVPARRKSE